VWLYRLSLRLYPRSFRDEFDHEMVTVFADAVTEATRRGWVSLLALWLRELRDLPSGLIREYGSRHTQGETDMSEIEGRLGRFEDRGVAPQQRPTWTAVVLGTLPLLTLGAVTVFNEMDWPSGWDSRYLYLAWSLVLMVGLTVGWVKGFPRWSFPFISLSLLSGWWWSETSTPGLRILGHTFRHQERWGWRGWIPLLLAIIMALLWTRSSSPLRRLVKSVWRDGTLLSFALYSLIAWIYIVAVFDEIHDPYLVAYMLISTVVLTFGAIGYLLSSKAWQRIVALLAGVYVNVVIEGVVNQAYWSERMELGWASTVWGQALLATVYVAIMCAPALFNLRRRPSKPMSTA
jgi:hypothetical protein